MGEHESDSKIYFCATNTCDRILAGDFVLIDTACEITLGSIVLSAALALEQAELSPTEAYVGKVVEAYISI